MSIRSPNYTKKGPGRVHRHVGSDDGRWVRGTPGAKVAKKIAKKTMGKQN